MFGNTVEYDYCDDLPDAIKVGMKSLSGSLGSADPDSKKHKEEFNLARLNDSGYTFEEIADILYWYVQSGLHKDI